MSYNQFPRALDTALMPTEVLFQLVEFLARESHKAFKIWLRHDGRGRTLRPGRDTPIWNALRRELRPHLKRYGDQVNLGRILGLPRQRINDFVTGHGRMPDAERTLQLLMWLLMQRNLVFERRKMSPNR